MIKYSLEDYIRNETFSIVSIKDFSRVTPNFRLIFSIFRALAEVSKTLFPHCHTPESDLAKKNFSGCHLKKSKISITSLQMELRNYL